MALHHIVTVLRKKRLILLVTLENPKMTIDKHELKSMSQYISQFTYVNYNSSDWQKRLLYALPLKGMLSDQHAYYSSVRLIDAQTK
jgi:hypothetical protein